MYCIVLLSCGCVTYFLFRTVFIISFTCCIYTYAFPVHNNLILCTRVSLACSSQDSTYWRRGYSEHDGKGQWQLTKSDRCKNSTPRRNRSRPTSNGSDVLYDERHRQRKTSVGAPNGHWENDVLAITKSPCADHTERQRV